ncbi:MAG: NitT/TauT family transport system permease protein, partial [Paracoccaceae bacterium]
MMSDRRGAVLRAIWPVAAVTLAIVAIWYVAAAGLNMAWERDQAARAGTAPALSLMLANTMAQDRPVMPAP